jgi:lipopolysaccharide/colanic/teichoic acid biosynthesis glycosyltransferase
MKIKNNYINKFLIDGILLFVVFFVVYYVKRGDVLLAPSYYSYLGVYFLGWLFSTLVTGKCSDNRAVSYPGRLKPFVIAAIIHLGIISIALYLLKSYELSRFIVYGSVAGFFILEVVFVSGLYVLLFKDGRIPREQEKAKTLPVVFFAVEILSVLIFYLAACYFKYGSINLSEDYRILLAVILCLWFFVGLGVHKFRIPVTTGYLKAVWPFAKSIFIIVGITAFFIFGVRIFEYSRAIVFFTLVFIALFEIASVTIYFIYIAPEKTDEAGRSFVDAACSSEKEIIGRVVSDGTRRGEKVSAISCESARYGIFRDQLNNVYLNRLPREYAFIDKYINLSSIDVLSSLVMSSGNPYNVEILPEQSLQVLINLHELNDFRRVNEYLIKVSKALQDGGIFICKFQPKENRRIYFLQNYPYYLANILYFVDFIWKRVFPKLPVLKKIYFAMSKGRNRVLSLTEGLGRISFCGFDIVAMEEIDSWVYFIAIKVAEPSTDPDPSYSPVFKMRRTGKNGKPIYVYKFRTMYPYSEYIQNNVTAMLGYGAKGKVENDFRITSWGKFLRRYWLDEIPQLYNFIRGELALVGVRPLSDRFLANYPEDLKNERMKRKPGCLPPYVAYRMQAVDDYIESERIYLNEKKKHPVWTDVKVFFLVVYNVLAKRIESE